MLENKVLTPNECRINEKFFYSSDVLRKRWKINETFKQIEYLFQFQNEKNLSIKSTFGDEHVYSFLMFYVVYDINTPYN